MSELARLSMSIDKSLLDKLETLVEHHGYANRSEFFRDLIRDRLVQEEWERDAEVVGTITLVYNHQQRQLSQKLTQVQHHHHDVILATTHVHLDHEMCAEMIIAKGKAAELQQIVNDLGQQRGVVHCALSMSSTGIDLH